MKKILIATHGTFASGAESTVKFLMGDVGNITCINAYVDQDENLAETLEQYFARVQPEDQVIVLTDIKGGSVNQKIVPYAVRENVFLIAGFKPASAGGSGHCAPRNYQGGCPAVH